MSLETLIELEDEDGDYVSVTLDDEDGTVFFQYNFLTLTLTPEEFDGLADAVQQAQDALPK